MSKRLKLVSSSKLGEDCDRPTKPIDWARCMICQDPDDSDLLCPANNANESVRNTGYVTLANNLAEFQLINSLPDDINLQLFDEGHGGIEKTLIERKAKWHKSCALRYSSMKLDRAKKRKLADEDVQDIVGHSATRQDRRSQASTSQDECFFCEASGTRIDQLFNVTTFEVDRKVRQCATEQGNNKLLAKLSSGDLIAQEAKYHARCLAGLYNRSRTVNKPQNNSSVLICDSVAFAELANFVKKTLKQTEESHPVLKMSNLTRMYEERLNQLLFENSGETDIVAAHSSRLRERILQNFPQMTATKSGRDYMLTYDKAIGDALKEALPPDHDQDILALLRVTKMIRKEVMEHECLFNGHFDEESQIKSMPRALLAVVNMLLYGSNIQDNHSITQPALTISQILCFNVQGRKPKGNIVRHQTLREPALPVYLGLSTFGKTRSKEVVHTLHSLGLSISYTRVLEVSSSLCQVAVEQFEKEKVLCHPKLRKGIFTIAAYDNIDHNPSSTTSEDSFHGTSLSLFQIPTIECSGEKLASQTMELGVGDKKTRTVPKLPDAFVIVKPAFLHNKEPNVPSCAESTAERMTSRRVEDIKNEEKVEIAWLLHVNRSCNIGENIGLDISWAGYHASHERTQKQYVSAISCLLPLFYEDSSSVGMIKHGINIVSKITRHVNESQVPVIAMDQPLFAKAKLIQWNWPDVYGESKLMIMFGAFHIEQAFLRVLGQWMKGSGWEGALVNSGIATAGIVEGFLKVTHVTKARAIHQVTAAALYQILQEAYQEDNLGVQFDAWCSKRSEDSPTFKFWMQCLELEILLLLFVRSIRQGNYSLYLDSLKSMIPWFFLMDRHNYARWLPVHLKDLYDAETNLPGIHSAFIAGQFVIRKTNRRFSAISIDQAHEQNNAIVKAEGGAVGLTQNPSALTRWMVSGPEISRLLQEFEDHIKPAPDEDDVSLHHEQYPAFQQKFISKVNALKQSLLQLGSPFLENGKDLIVIDSRIIANKDVVETVNSAEHIGRELFRNFVADRLVSKSHTVFEPLKKIRVSLFSTPSKRASKQNTTLKCLKTDVQLFSRLFIVSQNRQLDMDSFFCHENQPFPPALSSNGELRVWNKSDLAHILENTVTNKDDHLFTSTCDAILYDGAALANILKPRSSGTFGDYCLDTFKPHVCKDIEVLNPKRIDLIWDQYISPSIKGNTREKRGAGTRLRVAPNTMVPKDWQGFLRNSDNKEELFSLLGDFAISTLTHVQVITTAKDEVKGSVNAKTELIGVNCSGHEEADSKIILHLRDLVDNGFKSVIIRTVDTDVLVLAIAYYFVMSSKGLEKLWIAFGTGKSYRVIPAHAIAETLGQSKSEALPGFHAFTGCDSIPDFTGKTKKSTWKTWMQYEEATTAFSILSRPQISIPDEISTILERYVVLLYNYTSELTNVNEARKELFMTKNRPLQSLPPTKGALIQQVLRAAFQGGHVWGQAHNRTMSLPSPSEWGWLLEDESWKLKWSELPEIWGGCRDLRKCACNPCKSSCGCRRSGLPCTLLCKCNGDCSM